jgi:hypothetical protein
MWCGVGLLTLAFFSVHFLIQAAPLSGLVEAHDWMLAAAAAGMALIVLVLGLGAMFMDRRTLRDDTRFLKQVVDAAIEGISLGDRLQVVLTTSAALPWRQPMERRRTSCCATPT